MSKKVHINAIMHEIDEYLSFRILESKISDNDKLLSRTETINNIKYVFKLIDITKTKEIGLLFDYKLDDYLFKTEANTIEQFKKNEIERLQNYKMHFSDNETDSKYKKYNNILNKLIIYLTKMNLDIRFLVQSYESDTDNLINYSFLINYIKEKGFFVINSNLKPAKIFTPELAYVLLNQNLQIKNFKTDTVKYINGTYLWATYIEAYSQGEKYFKVEYKASSEILYGSNCESYIKNLHYKYHHDLTVNPYEGWKFVKKYYPELITHKQIALFGFYSGVINSLEEVIKEHPKVFQSFNKYQYEEKTENLELTTLQSKTEPTLKVEVQSIVFDILKDFFDEEQQGELKQLLETGKNTSKHLIFFDNGNRLADVFKQLKKADLITKCTQSELESWIKTNFMYLNRKQVKEYTARYLNDIISSNKDKCQRPILNVILDKTTGKMRITKV